MGVEVDQSMKSHPELAGEGIEYSWGQAKSVYRRAKLAQKKVRRTYAHWWLTVFLLMKDVGWRADKRDGATVFSLSTSLHTHLFLH